ncbi:MAG TPA: hypothetical protein VLM44_00080 [Lutibacter sp.]|nr:hypothetical protein [Lutibacter sp.]
MKITVKLCLVFLLLSSNLFSQTVFPKSWEGNYKGELQIFGVDSVRMKLMMKLDILQKSDSVYQFKIIYDFKGKEDKRDYELKIVDAKIGKYVIDEKNTIVIDAFFKMDILTSFFKVMDSYIISTYTKINDELIFEIISADGKNPKSSGNAKFESEDIPDVKSYMVNGRQKAVLIKY